MHLFSTFSDLYMYMLYMQFSDIKIIRVNFPLKLYTIYLAVIFHFTAIHTAKIFLLQHTMYYDWYMDCASEV